MLLTSAQVSVAISSTIVSIFTITLFLCGYVLQQRTVNNIREAIKPQVHVKHNFAYTVPSTIAATATPNPLGNEGAQIIEVSSTNLQAGSPYVKTGQNAASANQDQNKEGASSANLLDHSEQGRQPVNQERISKPKDDSDMPPQRRKPSQVENDKKDKEWAAKVKKAKEENKGKKEIPLEQLSRAARRKLYKEQLAVQEGQQPRDPNMYRPRRRLW